MQTRRSFFSRVAAIVAAVALAPEIAFSHKLDIGPSLNLQELFDAVYAMARTGMYHPEIDILTDKAGLDALYAMTGERAFQSPFTEPMDMKSCRVVGVYEQLRGAA